MKRLLANCYSWEFLLLAYLVFILITLTGCTTFVSTTLGETEYAAHLSLEKNEVLD